MKHPTSAYSLRRKISLLLHRWHRRIGVLASLFVIWMVLSGWLLNHTAALDLARHIIRSPLLAQHYGLHTDVPPLVFNADSHWLVQTQDALLLDAKAVDAKTIDVETLPPVGMASSRDILFVASSSQLLLLGADGGAIDTLSGSSLPIERIKKIGSGCDGAVIANGEKVFATRDGITWAVCGDAVVWSRPQALTDNQRTIIEPLLQPGISLERLLLDLHSGRFLGRWGPYFIDAVGLGLLVLALSGLWMFGHQRQVHRRTRRQPPV